MPFQHRLHPLAYQDIIEGYAWYEDQQKGLGDKFLLTVEKKITAISSNPEVYGSKQKKNFREALVKPFPYIIVYKLYKEKKEIFISSIHHAKKHPRKKFRK